MNSRRFVCFAAMALAIFLAVGGAGQAATTRLVMLVPNTAGQIPVAEALAARFMEKNPDIAIEVEARPGGSEGDNLVKTRLATGTMSDLFVANSGSKFLELRPETYFTPMSSLPCMPAISPEFKSVVSAGGDVYGVPFGTTMAGGIFYNKKIYSDLGLTPPKSWAEFMANCAKIKAAGIVPVIQSYRNTWTSQLLVLSDFHNVLMDAPDFAEEYTANQAKFADTPAARKGFERLWELHNAGYFNGDFGAATFTDGVHMMATGEGAHYPMLSNTLAIWTQDYPENLGDIGFFAQPGDDAAKNGLTVWMPLTVYVAKTSEHQDAALKFADFVGSAEGAGVFMSVNGAYGPPVVAGVDLPEGTPSAVYEMLPYFESGRVSPALEYLSPIKGPILEQITVEVGSGMRNPEDAAALYDEDVRKQAQQLNLPGW